MIYCYAWKKFLKVYYICYECTVYNDLFHLDGISEGHKSEQWTKQVDRGVLIHVSHDVFMTFYSFEMELRKHLTADSNYSLKDRALQSILINEDVLFHWANVSFHWGDQEAKELLKLIAEHWITVRGFSFISGLMGKYKQSQKKRTQKSKGLRKTLDTSSISNTD